MPERRTSSLELYQSHRGALVNYAYGIVGDRPSAEDVVQDAWLRIEAVERLRPLTEPLAYFYRTVRNLALDVYRARKRRALVSLDDPQHKAADHVDTLPSPEAVVADRSALAQLIASLDELPERTRRAVILYKVEGLKLREVAEELNISIGLAQSLVVDGVAHCATRLSR